MPRCILFFGVHLDILGIVLRSREARERSTVEHLYHREEEENKGETTHANCHRSDHRQEETRDGRRGGEGALRINLT